MPYVTEDAHAVRRKDVPLCAATAKDKIKGTCLTTDTLLVAGQPNVDDAVFLYDRRQYSAFAPVKDYCKVFNKTRRRLRKPVFSPSQYIRAGQICHARSCGDGETGTIRPSGYTSLRFVACSCHRNNLHKIAPLLLHCFCGGAE